MVYMCTFCFFHGRLSSQTGAAAGHAVASPAPAPEIPQVHKTWDETCSQIIREIFVCIRGKHGGLMVTPIELQIERSEFERWPGSLCCFLGQDT